MGKVPKKVWGRVVFFETLTIVTRVKMEIEIER